VPPPPLRKKGEGKRRAIPRNGSISHERREGGRGGNLLLSLRDLFGGEGKKERKGRKISIIGSSHC